MKNLIAWTGLGLAGLGSVMAACSDGFTSCKETRTCQPHDGGAGNAGDAGVAGGGSADGEGGSASGDGVGGESDGAVGGMSGGNTATAHAGQTGEGGSSAEPECSPAEKRCIGNALQTCGDDHRFGAAQACPDETPICHLEACRVPPSCTGLPSGCGTENENCCASRLIEGGEFDRENDLNYPASVADFRLNKYEVTVARFRKFVSAVMGGWTPPTGSGKHAHLNGGKGLASAADAASFEAGWQAAWTAMLPATKADWSTALNCSAPYQTWTLTSGANEQLPINCADWLSAYAFCTWDGGFLPSQAELRYAAAGGKEQRLYPWGDEVPGANADLAAYGCNFGGMGTCTGIGNIPPVGSIPAGSGKWGHLDLGGSVFEWALDFTGEKPATCDNCAVVTESSAHFKEGGSFASDHRYMLATAFMGYTTAPKTYELGLRCAHAP